MPRSSFSWFPEGPPLTHLPMPVLDPECQWGNKKCKQCSGFCSGHFVHPQAAVSSFAIPMTRPPSAIIQQAFKESTNVSELAEKAFLPEEEVKIWISHLENVDANPKLGAKKAAATRYAKISSSHSTLDGSNI